MRTFNPRAFTIITLRMILGATVYGWTTPAHALEKKSLPPARVETRVELGESELNAEVRKPSFELLDSNQTVRSLAQEIARRQFERLEQQILQGETAKLPQTKGPVQ